MEYLSLNNSHNQNFKKMMRKLKTTLLLVAGLFFAISCNDYFNGASSEVDQEQSKQNRKGKNAEETSVDEDSDRPDWAGGNTDLNPHNKGNDDSGIPRGEDYGDLYQLLRDENGVPGMIQIGAEWYVQPVDVEGFPLELNAEGELVDPSLATEVEFGRLNIVRSPQSVLDQALNESMKVLAAPGAVLSLDFCGRLTSTYPDLVTGETIVKTIDSPRENMALYQHIMKYMFTDRLGFLGEAPNNFDPLTIAASCFAAGSDKTGTVDIDEVVYINGFIECEGLYPILNELEYKWYFNFGNIDGLGKDFEYDRNVYKDRNLQFYNFIDGEYVPWKVMTVWDAMEEAGLFTYKWGEVDNTLVSGFALAIDDAVQVLDYYHAQIPILGICLGRQAIGEFFNGRINKAKFPKHGKISYIFHGYSCFW